MRTLSNRISDTGAQDTARDLIVTFIEDHPKAILLLLAASRRAREIQGRWRVIFIETPHQNTQKDNVWNEHRLRLLTRAKQMGAETEHLEALSLFQGMRQVMEKEADRLALVIIGKIEPENRLRRWRASPWIKLTKIASTYAKVEVVPLTGEFRQPLKERLLSRLKEVRLVHMLYALTGTAIPALLTVFLKWTLPPALFRINEQNVGILFIIACAFIAGRYGLIPGLITAITSFFVENYFFTIPYYEIKLRGLTDFFSMGLFLSSALLISLFTSHMRDYAKKIIKREQRTEMLLALYRLTSESYSPQQAIETLKHHLERTLDADIAFFMPPMINPHILRPVCPEELELSDNDRNALANCWSEMKSTGIASPDGTKTNWRFEPMISTNGEIGVLGVRPHKSSQLDAWFGRMLTATAEQTAAILAHIELERSMEETRIGEEREKLRVMLLSSVSHDLKTPLAAIIGALSAHQSLGARLTPQMHKELVDGSLEEARRLDSFITNILDMTRLESGAVTFKQEWYGIKELTDDIVKRMQHRLKGRVLTMNFPPIAVEAYIDVIMTGQVLQNILDNACKYTSEDIHIDLSWHINEDKELVCTVRDHGSGIPEDKLNRIFDKFARLRKTDSQIAGTGLGLAIAKAVMESQHGWIKAENHEEGGAMFTLCLPSWRHITDLEQGKIAYASH